MSYKRRKFARGSLEYLWPIYSVIMIGVWLWYSGSIWGKDIPPVIIAIAGLMFQIPIGLFWTSYKRPILEIDGVEFGELNIGTEWVYKVNSVIVKNVGRSAAKNCKGYILVGDKWEGKKRVCWAVSAERPNATINVKDDERLNICAFYVKGPDNINLGLKSPKIIIPTELDWSDHYKVVSQYPWDLRSISVKNKSDKRGQFRIYVTAENTKSVDVLVKVDELKGEIEIVEDLSLSKD